MAVRAMQVDADRPAAVAVLVLTARLVDGAAPGWSVLLEGVHDIVGDGYESTPRGVRLYPDDDQVVAQVR